MQRSRVGERPSLVKEEWECVATSITRGNYKRASNGTVWMWMIQQRLLGESGRHGRQNRVGRSREQVKK